MRIPKRFGILRPYIASLLFSTTPRPPFKEVMAWFAQGLCEKRAMRFIESLQTSDGFRKVKFKGRDQIFYHPVTASWIEFCAFIDELMNDKHWHNYTTGPTPLVSNDVVVDCGAAEGLFCYLALPIAKQIYAIEPMPAWQPGLAKMFSNCPTVELIPMAVSYKQSDILMSDFDGYSKVAADGAIRIQATTIDRLFFDKGISISYLKADIEGFEYEMLLGAENTIKACRPKITMAVYHIENSVPQIVSYLRRLHADYRIETKGIAPNGNPVLMQVY